METARVMQLAGSTAGRVVSVLLTLANEHDLRKPFACHFSHGELADMAGCARESVSRTMQELERQGTIRITGSNISLLKTDLLMNRYPALLLPLQPSATPSSAGAMRFSS